MADLTVRLVVVTATAVLLVAAEMVRVVVLVHLRVFPHFCPLNKLHCHFPEILNFFMMEQLG
jgi:hypothetical protein